MKNKLRYEYVWIDDVKYPMTVSYETMRTIGEIANERDPDGDGDISKFMKEFGKDKGFTAERIEEITMIGAAMISAGCDYFNFIKKTPYPCAPIQDGQYIPISSFGIRVSADLNCMQELPKKIIETFNASQQKEIQTKPVAGSKKNKKH